MDINENQLAKSLRTEIHRAKYMSKKLSDFLILSQSCCIQEMSLLLYVYYLC